jgi:hypothetical protein
VTIPEFADRVIMPCTHAETREAAIRHGEEVRNGFATTARRLCIRKILAAKCLNVRASTAIPQESPIPSIYQKCDRPQPLKSPHSTNSKK